MSDKVSGKKFVKSYFEFMPWLKTIRFGSGLVIILFIIFTMYRAYFMKTDNQEITIGRVEKGGTVIIESKKDNRKVGLNMFVTSSDVGAVFFKDIGDGWQAGLGAEYDFNKERILPRAELKWTW